MTRQEGYKPSDREAIYSCVGKGWRKILEELLDSIGDDIMIWQVKEKFGGLRFYTARDEAIKEAIHRAETKSLRTCENCGEKGTKRLQNKAWWKTLCDKCDRVEY